MERRAVEGGWEQDIAFVAGGRSITHADVHDGAARAASVLAELGVGRDDRVLIALPDGFGFVWAFLGTVRMGAIAVPINPRLTPTDHRRAEADAGARVVVCGAELAERFAGGRTVTADVAADAPAYAQYTSGTTGSPRAAVHAHGDPLVYFEAFARQAIAIGRADVVLSVSKLYFAYGLGNSLFFPLLAGCRAVLHSPHPRPDAIAEEVRDHGVTVLFAVPTFYAHLAAAAAARPNDWSSLRVAVSAGEALSVTLAGRARSVLGCPILDGLGSTEVGQTFASNTLARCRDGTVGQALPPYRLSVRDDEGRPLAPGRVGDLWVSGPTLLLGRLGDPPGEAARTAGEWFCTGDRAELEGDGSVRLHGRSDDVELVGGISLSPLEIEAVLSRHPAVTEVAVAGIVGGDGASRLHAFVVPAPGSGVEAIEAELITLARAELAPFKVPHVVELVDALPRTPTGKLRRFVLRSGAWRSAWVPSQAPASAPNRLV